MTYEFPFVIFYSITVQTLLFSGIGQYFIGYWNNETTLIIDDVRHKANTDLTIEFELRFYIWNTCALCAHNENIILFMITLY